MTSDQLRIVSHFPGRLRVRAKAFREAARGDEVVAQLREDTGVTSATCAPLTGSVLVEYDARVVQLPQLVQRIVRLGGLEGVEADHHGGEPRFTGPVIRESLDRWNGALMGATKGRVDARIAVPTTLASLGVLTFLFGRRRLPEWYDLIFWSFVTFQNLNHLRPIHDGDHP